MHMWVGHMVGRILGRGVLAAMAATLAAAAGVPALARPAGGVQIQVNGAPQSFISADEISDAMDAFPNVIAYRASAADAPGNRTTPGTSVAELARLAGRH